MQVGENDEFCLACDGATDLGGIERVIVAAREIAGVVTDTPEPTAIWIARRPQPESAAMERPGTILSEAVRADSPRLGTVQLVWICIGLSGVAAMIYQVAWTRVLTMIIGSSTYAFSIVVALFLVGLSAGALLVGRIRRVGNLRNVVFKVELMIATSLATKDQGLAYNLSPRDQTPPTVPLRTSA